MNFGTHWLNLGLRFGLELWAFYAFGRAGARLASGATGVALMVVLPLIAATLWGVFAVPGDPSRSGRAPVPVTGAMRLGLELAFFSLAALALWRSEAKPMAIALGAFIVVHYALSRDRLGWLLAH